MAVNPTALATWKATFLWADTGGKMFPSGSFVLREISARALATAVNIHRHLSALPWMLWPPSDTGKNVRVVYLVSPERPAVPFHWRKRAAHPQQRHVRRSRREYRLAPPRCRKSDWTVEK